MAIVKYTKDCLIEYFWKYYIDYNKFPKSNDFRKAKGFPDLGVIRRTFGSWNSYLKEVGIIDKNTNDGWYIHDEAVLRKYYSNNKIDIIINKLMVKRKEASIRGKALTMGLMVNKEAHYKSKFKDVRYIENMIRSAKEFYIANNRSPYRRELNYSDRAFDVNWKSYNDFLNECNLPIIRRKVEIKNKQDGINLLLKMKKDLSRNPTVEDLDKYGINKNWFAKKFGSYRDALYEAGLISEIDYNINLKIDVTIKKFQELYKKTGIVPSYREFQKFASKNNLLTANTLMEKLNLYPYTKLCRRIFGESNWNDFNKDELLNLLVKLKNKLNRVPMATELRKYGLPSYNVYKTAFNVRYFKDIIKLLGWEPYSHDPTYRTDKELLDDFSNLYNNLGRLPYVSEFRENAIADYTVYMNRFKDIETICAILKINYKLEELKNGAGYRCYDKNGGLCKSINEMVITNILIDSNIDYIKEFPYKKKLDSMNNINMDWYLNSLNIGVEFFGLFNEKYLTYDNWVGDYSRKTIEKITLSKSNNFPLIDIYPFDLENNFEGLKKKFSIYGIDLKINNNEKIVV